VQRHISRSPRLARLDALTQERLPLFALLARLVIVVPWNLFNYAASLTSIRFQRLCGGGRCSAFLAGNRGHVPAGGRARQP
jgi:hypothetical protein